MATAAFQASFQSNAFQVVGIVSQAETWTPRALQAESWAAVTPQAETWTPATLQAETWTPAITA